MKIGIIASDVNSNPAGLERYLFELVSHITQDTHNEYIIYVKAGGEQFMSVIGGRKNVTLVQVGWGKLWKEVGLFFAPHSDVYIFTGPIGSLLFTPKKSIVIAYDFAYKYTQDHASWLSRFIVDLYSRKSFTTSEKVVCISEETAHDLKKFFMIPESKIKVIYCGFNRISLLDERGVKLPSSKFFFFVGTLKERKNVLNIIKGFEQFLKSNTNSEEILVIAGKYAQTNSYYLNLIKYIDRSALLKAKVYFVGRVDDQELKFLYTHAQALVYPSIIEGFGLPILEAMDCGLPVITSSGSSLKEVAGGAAILVDPYSGKEISEAMTTVLDLKIREGMITRGYENVKKFSWEKMSREFISLIVNL
jgi:glycosyltransferase involved in cell wall biosynthesis